MTRFGGRKGRFVVSFFLGLIAWYIVGMTSVFSFSFLGLWTYPKNLQIGANYVRSSLVDDTVVGTTLANISFGQRLYHTDTSLGSVFDIFDTSRALVNIDILGLMTDATSPSEVLTSHLRHTEQTLNAIQLNKEQLSEKANQYLEASKVCFEDKRLGDEQFFAGLRVNDEGQTMGGLERTLEHAPCYITNRIQANAYAYLAAKVGSYESILQRRFNLLSENKSLLVEYSALFEGNVLDELYALKQEIRRVNEVSYEQFDGLYNFTIFSPEYTLPGYNSVFFPDGRTPQFDRTGFSVGLVWEFLLTSQIHHVI